MEVSKDKTTLSSWVSTSDQSELSPDQALTGSVNLFIEICAMLDVDPYLALDAFFKTSKNETKAKDFKLF